MSRFLQSVLAAVLALGMLAAVAAPDAAAPPGAAQAPTGGQPGARPDASDAPGYAAQTNQERALVQPGNNAPMWRDVGRGVEGYSSLPKSQAPEAGVLIQPFVQYPGSRLTNAGEAWRQVRNQWIIPYGGSFLLVVLGALAIFYWRKGVIRVHGQPTGVQIERFTPLERSAHWANAIAFVVLAVSGVTMAFGKFFIQPFIGDMLFGWLTFALKTAHNIAGPLFAVSLTIVFLTFVKDNLPQKGDLVWLLKGGGMLGDSEVPSHRFNAGEKVIFWGGVFALGLLVVASGLILDQLIPSLVYERATMQMAHMVHAVAAVLMLGMFIGHIYMGTIGTEGAYQAMKTGMVDETWAKEHHELWYNDIQANKIPANRSSHKAGHPANA
jgi:formate dehydrogenase subunit gamma